MAKNLNDTVTIDIFTEMGKNIAKPSQPEKDHVRAKPNSPDSPSSVAENRPSVPQRDNRSTADTRGNSGGGVAADGHSAAAEADDESGGLDRVGGVEKVHAPVVDGAEGGSKSVGRGAGGGRGGVDGSGREGESVSSAVGIDARLDALPLAEGGKKKKYRNNIAAIKTLFQLENEARHATQAEIEVLANYVGWGGLSEAFERGGERIASGWASEVNELKALLSAEEHRAAMLSTTDAHYTSKMVVQTMWQSIERMGFRGGKVLEPACGTGNFFGLMPPALYANSNIFGIEKDPITGRIAQQLYPSANIFVQGFEESAGFAPQAETYDLVIGNPPFGNHHVVDPKYIGESKHSIHNYFVLKSLKMLKPNGVLVMVISHYFMDANNPEVRLRATDDAEFLGAVRLPNDTFKSNAGTEVTTDIIYLRKFQENEVLEEEDRIKWLHIAQAPNENLAEEKNWNVKINGYYQTFRTNLLGQWGTFGKMRQRDELALIPEPGQDTAARLQGFIRNCIPENILTPAAKAVAKKSQAVDTLEEMQIDIDVDDYFIYNHQIYTRLPTIEGENRIVAADIPKNQQATIRLYINLRDSLERLINAELELPNADTDLDKLRAQLNAAYQTFIARNGFINSRRNRILLRKLPSWSKVSGLESYQEAVTAKAAQVLGTAPHAEIATKAAIFDRRMLGPNQIIRAVDNAQDALMVSINQFRRIDLDFMATIYSKSREEIISELDEQIFEEVDGQYVEQNAYLSGNVKAKLAEAKLLAKDNAKYQRNVDALEKVIPEDIAYVDINVKLGTSWIPLEIIEEFITETFGDKSPTVRYYPTDDLWIVKFAVAEHLMIKYTTDHISAPKIIDHIIRQTDITIMMKAGQDEQIADPVASEAANEKAEVIKEEFSNWIWQDAARRERLERIYNDKFNTDVVQQYDGSYLTLPGKVDNTVIALKKHQLDGIARITSGKTTLLHHVVGAGKTYTMIAGAMELKRLNLAKKPMIVVPNHLVPQWESEFTKLYPNAKVLVPEKIDFQRANRQMMYSRMALQDWDAIIVAHSTFDMIHCTVEAEVDLIEKQVAELVNIQSILDAEEGRKVSTKDIARRIKNLKAKQEALLHGAAERDQGYTWEQIGVDALFIDESQEYKNLFFSTRMQRVAGLGNTAGSMKAFNLFLKAQYMLENNGNKNLVFASGTPISNTIAEMYSLKKYLDYASLQKRGLLHFDAWARSFGEIATDYEITVTGGYKKKGRFSTFVNVPELIKWYQTIAHVITNKQIAEQAGVDKNQPRIPGIVGGKPQIVKLERTEAQGEIMDELVVRALNLELPDNMLAVMTDAKKAALDARIIDSRKYHDHEDNKSNVVSTRVKQIYDQTTDVKGTQIVFLDLSIPNSNSKTSGSFSVYEDMQYKMIAMGIPAKEIAFIHSANTDARKKRLFAEINAGRVRVLIGSTSKMGAGTNVQERLVALHHVDCPYRPDQVEQREGRILRPGNSLLAKNPDFKVELLVYVVVNTLDSKFWQFIEVKAGFIQQISNACVEGTQREIVESYNPARLAATIKAEASGDNRILEITQLEDDVRRLQNSHRAFKLDQSSIERQIRNTQSEKKRLPRIIDNLQKDWDIAQKIPIGKHFTITIEGKEYTDRKKAAMKIRILSVKHAKDLLRGELNHRRLQDFREKSFGEYGGFSLGFSTFSGSNNVRISINGSNQYLSNKIDIEEASDNASIGLISSMHYAATQNIKNSLKTRIKQFESIEKEITELKAQVKPEWPHRAELSQKKASLNKLEAELAAKTNQAKETQSTEEVEAENAVEETKSIYQRTQPTANYGLGK